MKKIVAAVAVIAIVGAFIIVDKLGLLEKNPKNNLGQSPTNTSQDLNSSVTNTPTTSSYKDGEYTGKVTDAFYGKYQVKVIIANGKISDIQFLQFPNDVEHSQEVSAFANPALRQEAIQSQNAKVDIVTGATQTSIAFRESLQSALDQAM